MVRRLLACASLALLAAAPVQGAPIRARTKTLPAPVGLRGFLLRADEKATDTFPRTPTVSVPVSLPWMTGKPYALYAHVRATTRRGLTSWSVPYGFNMRWKSLPEQITPDFPGLIRWLPVEGATSYDVWFADAGKVISTVTNVADEREYYTFHHDPLWSGQVQWRVRAVRKIYGGIPSGLPVVVYGPWSSTFTSVNPEFGTGSLSLTAVVSESVSTPSYAAAH